MMISFEQSFRCIYHRQRYPLCIVASTKYWESNIAINKRSYMYTIFILNIYSYKRIALHIFIQYNLFYHKIMNTCSPWVWQAKSRYAKQPLEAHFLKKYSLLHRVSEIRITICVHCITPQRKHNMASMCRILCYSNLLWFSGA